MIEERFRAVAPTAPAGGAQPPQRRLRAVTFVAGLSILQGLVALGLVGGYAFVARVFPSTMQGPDAYIPIEDLVLISLSGLTLLFSAVGLLLLRPWGWTLAMATQCLTLTVTLYGYLSGDPDYLVMTLGVLAVLLLNRQEVRSVFARPGSGHG